MTREEAIKILQHCGAENYCSHYIGTENCYGCNRLDALELAIEALKKRPTGEWVNRQHCQVDEDAYEIATCSNCKAEITLEYPNDNFCPNCGADMRGEEE